MKENSFENTLVQSLKGAAASILWALLLAGSRLNKGALSMVTGYTDKPVSRALTLLTEMGLVEGKDREGWQLSSKCELILLDKLREKLRSDYRNGRSDAEILAVLSVWHFSETDILVRQVAEHERNKLQDTMALLDDRDDGLGSNLTDQEPDGDSLITEPVTSSVRNHADPGVLASIQGRDYSDPEMLSPALPLDNSDSQRKHPEKARSYSELNMGEVITTRNQVERKISEQIDSRNRSDSKLTPALKARFRAAQYILARLATDTGTREDLVSLSVVDPDQRSQQQTKQQQTAVVENKSAEVNQIVAEESATNGQKVDDMETENSVTPAELAWRWYYCTQEVDGDPGSLAAGRFILGHPPPAGFLALAHYWPEICRHERAMIIEAIKKGISCEHLAQFWAHKYPELTAEAFLALMALFIDAPEELESVVAGE